MKKETLKSRGGLQDLPYWELSAPAFVCALTNNVH